MLVLKTSYFHFKIAFGPAHEANWLSGMLAVVKINPKMNHALSFIQQIFKKIVGVLSANNPVSKLVKTQKPALSFNKAGSLILRLTSPNRSLVCTYKPNFDHHRHYPHVLHSPKIYFQQPIQLGKQL